MQTARSAMVQRLSPLTRSSLLWLAVLGGPDLYAHGRYLAASSMVDRLAYMVTLAGSWALFSAVIAGLLRLRVQRPQLALGLSILYGAWIGIGVALAVPYRVRFGQDLPASYLSFLVQNTTYGWRLFRAETGTKVRWLMAAGLLAVALGVIVFTRVKQTRVVSARLTRMLAAAGILVLALSLVRKRASLPADFHEARVAVATLSLLSDPGRLPRPARPTLPPVTASVRPNVVLLLGESLSAEEWAPWSDKPGPGLTGYMEAHPDSLVPMRLAVAGGGATDISVPSILTGLRSDNSAKDFARAPLLWHEARARGYRTALFSSQDYTWLHLGEFLLGADQPDAVRVMKDYPGAPLVNDGAIDDALAVDAAIEFVDAMPKDQPFFLIVHFNVTHFPSWAPGLNAIPTALEAHLIPGGPLRRPPALAYMETLQRRVLDHLADKGLLDETLVVCTSDHGVGSRPQAPVRLESHYDDVLRVPLGIQLPKSVRSTRADAVATLAANATKRTTNADIYPTVLDVWGSEPTVAADRPALAGSSLLRPLPDRAVLAMSTGPVRGWHRHAFALYHGRYKWLVDEQDGLRVFDVTADPKETTNVRASVPAAEVARFVTEVRKSRPMLQIVEGTAPELLAR